MSQTKALHVLMGGLTLGTITEEKGKHVLTYDQAWLERDDGGVPLSMSLPLTSAVHKGDVVTHWLWNLLPDNEITLSGWAKKFQVSAGNPFAILGHTGEDCPGAVQFVTPERLESVRETGDIEFIDEIEIGRRLRRLRQDSGTSGRKAGETGQFSLAGAQPKTALALQGGRWGVPSGRVPTTHIIKPPSLDLDGQVENEHICLVAAGKLGHKVARTGIVSFDGEVAIVVKRFDRVQRGDKMLRAHQEDLCQSLGIHPRDKYESDGGPTIRSCMQNVMRYTTDAKASRKAFMDAVIYNHVIGGPDAHGKNYSIQIAAGGRTQLAPLYDIASIAPYEDTQRVRMAMRIGGKYGLDEVMPRHWQMEAKSCSMPTDDVFASIRDTITRAPDAFADAARESREKGLRAPILDKLTDAIATRCARMAKIYGVEVAPAPAREAEEAVSEEPSGPRF